MTPRQKLANRFERALLTGMMLSIAFVMEKLLDRVVEGPHAHSRPDRGRGLLGRLMSSVHLHHDQSHQPQAQV